MDTSVLVFTFVNFLFHGFKSIVKVYLVALPKKMLHLNCFGLVRADNAGLVYYLYMQPFNKSPDVSR